MPIHPSRRKRQRQLRLTLNAAAFRLDHRLKTLPAGLGTLLQRLRHDKADPRAALPPLRHLRVKIQQTLHPTEQVHRRRQRTDVSADDHGRAVDHFGGVGCVCVSAAQRMGHVQNCVLFFECAFAAAVRGRCVGGAVVCKNVTVI